MGSSVAPLGFKSPKPPKGYELDTKTAPAFLQQGLDMSKVKTVPAPPPQNEDEKQFVSYISPKNPYEINVAKPASYTAPVQNHELTHTFQNTRNPALGSVSAPVDKSKGTTANMYTYGGMEGLKKATSISHFNEEQQANIVMDYKSAQDGYLAKVKAGTATPSDLRKMYETHQTYHPLVRQLAAMPGVDAKLQPSALDMVLNRNMPSLDLKPEAPGLPSYDTPGLGVAPADPLLGGQSQPTARKVGEIKRFPNGKIGRWDGHGWRTQ